MTAPTYEVREGFHWAREGFSPRAIHVVEHEGFERTSTGFRIYRDGKVMYPAYAPFGTRAEAEAKIAELVGA